MESTKESELIELYVDFEFLQQLSDYVKDPKNMLLSEFDVAKSFLSFIQKPHVKLIAADTNKVIRKEDISRVFLPGYHHKVEIKSSSNYYFNKNADYGKIKNPQSLFFGQEYEGVSTDLSNLYGITFSDLENFFICWEKLVLLNTSQTFHIKQSDNPIRFWEERLKCYVCPVNAILVVEPFLTTWNNQKLLDNLLPILQSLSSERDCSTYKIQLTILTKFDDTSKNTHFNDTSKNTHFNELDIEACIRPYSHVFDYQIFVFDLVEMYRVRRGAELTKLVRNVLHDRYIFANYTQFISSHSFDMVYGRGVQKDTQIIVASLLKEDFYGFAKSKLKSYKQIIDWHKHAHPAYNAIKFAGRKFTNKLFN